MEPVPDPEAASKGLRSRDPWIGLLFLVFGVLVSGYAILAFNNGMPLPLWGTAALLGPVLVLLGSAAFLRVLPGRR